MTTRVSKLVDAGPTLQAAHKYTKGGDSSLSSGWGDSQNQLELQSNPTFILSEASPQPDSHQRLLCMPMAVLSERMLLDPL